MSTPATRRTPSTSASPPATSIARGATARSAVSPRVTSPLSGSTLRRSSTLKATSPPASSINGETKESLSEMLKKETEHKEQLLIQIQNKDQTIANLTTETDNLISALKSAESRVNELYTDQNRMEEELATRLGVVENLRSQIRDLEKEKRELQRRYNEQTITFDAERQALYDMEQHLKSRIQSLTQVRNQPDHATTESAPEDEPEPEDDQNAPPTTQVTHETEETETEPAEMTSLRLELSTLSTSYASLQSTLMLLQTQLVDLKRVNQELQEENESFTILLRERTLSGQFHVMKQVGETSSDGEDDDEGDLESNVGSLRSASKPPLEIVEEAPEEGIEQGQEPSPPFRSADPAPPTPRYANRNSRKDSRSTSHSPSNSVPRGESLADLPITGPGLDLAAELGRAENKDILDGLPIDENDRSPGKSKRSKKSHIDKNVTSPSEPPSDVDALRNEVKSLKDANKALTLYASKILDRIIAQEGFEHILSAEYDKRPPPSRPLIVDANPPPVPDKKQRPQSTATSFWKPVVDSVQQPVEPATPKSVPTSPDPTAKRRSISLDWRSFSLFGGAEKKEPQNQNLRPLTLKPGGTTIINARKLDSHEDEEDRRERDRLNATMKLMGIQPQASSPASFATQPTPTATNVSTSEVTSPRPSSRFPFIWNSSSARPETPPAPIDQGPTNLTQEALEHAEAESKLSALDARERALSLEMAKGAGGGFTEIAPRGAEERRSRRSRRSGGESGSGSTVWSAGMSGADEEAEEQ